MTITGSKNLDFSLCLNNKVNLTNLRLSLIIHLLNFRNSTAQRLLKHQMLARRGFPTKRIRSAVQATTSQQTLWVHSRTENPSAQQQKRNSQSLRGHHREQHTKFPAQRGEEKTAEFHKSEFRVWPLTTHTSRVHSNLGQTQSLLDSNSLFKTFASKRFASLQVLELVRRLHTGKSFIQYSSYTKML